MANGKSTPWNSLEITKVIISALTPLLLFTLGILINSSVKTEDRSIALRSEIYRTIGGDLNDIYCYIAFVGNWKELTPNEVIAKKRAADRTMYTYRPFFSQELFDRYETFMNEAFAPFSEAGKDARIRADIESANGDRRKHSAKGWDASWEDRFVHGDRTAQQEAYFRLLQQLKADLKL